MPALPLTDTLEISVHDAAEHLSNATTDSSEVLVQWIDCREEDEYTICRIEGSRLIPLSNFMTVMGQTLSEDTNHPIIVYCHHGMRSLQVTNFLRQKGHPNVWSLAGGIDLWAQEIDVDLTRY